MEVTQAFSRIIPWGIIDNSLGSYSDVGIICLIHAM